MKTKLTLNNLKRDLACFEEIDEPTRRAQPVNILYSSTMDTRFSLSAHLFPELFETKYGIVGHRTKPLSPAELEIIKQDPEMIMWHKGNAHEFRLALMFGLQHTKRR